MSCNSNNESKFYVVQFITTPSEGTDDYVCIPDSWLRSSKERKEMVIVTYPTNEDPIVTKERVKGKERYNNEWKYYFAAIKYESDTYSDAEEWIAARNHCGPLVINESTTTDKQQIIPLNEELQSSNKNHSSEFITDSWKPLPRPSIKRAAPEPQKHLFGKHLKLDDAAQSSSAIVTDANTESKKEKMIIIQDDQSIECTQEKKAAAASTSNETQYTEQNKQALSLPVKDVNELPKVIDRSIDEENHSQGIKKPDRNKSTIESHLLSNTSDSRCITKKFAQSMTAEEPSTSTERTAQPNQYNNQVQFLVSINLPSNFQPQIDNFQSLANVHNDHEIRDHLVSSKLKSTSIPGSVDNSEFNHFRAQRLLSTQRPTEKEICPMNIKENVATEKPSNLMDQTASSSVRSVEEKQPVVSKNYVQDGQLVREMYTGNSKGQIGPLRSTAVSFEETQQHLPKINAKPDNMTFFQDPRNGFQSASNYHNRLHSQMTRLRIPSIGHNSTNSFNPLHLTSELPRERQSQPSQQDIQQQPQIPKGVTKKTLPPMLTKVPNSLSTTHNKCYRNELQLRANQSKSAFDNENHLNKKGNVCQIDKLEEETLSQLLSYHNMVNSVSNAVTDHEANMSKDDAPMETTNIFFANERTSGSRCVDRPIASQNSTFPNQQTHPKVVLKQKMLEKFNTLFTEMDSTLQYTRKMYQNLQDSIYNTAELYKQAKHAVLEYNKAGKVSNAFPASNFTPDPNIHSCTSKSKFI